MQKAVERDDYEDGPGNKEGARRELQHIHIEPMGLKDEGKGVVSHVVHMAPARGQGGGPSHDVSEEKTHHPTFEHFSAHMEKHLMGHFEPTNEEETDGYEHKPGTEAEG